ncbi:hypothetical protein [Bacillus sp. FSL K6-3431]|uniref:hypothetical protein n=1 Tax=Bacillus sp. FSL K6-3431 TaxID=2921500 RepID=UPI0030F7DA85
MIRKQGLKIINGSVSPPKQQQTGQYMGRKIGFNQTERGGISSRSRKFGGGCGCGSNPKQLGRK